MIIARSANEAFWDVCATVLSDDDGKAAPRGRPTLETIGLSFRLTNPRDRVVTVPQRGISMSKLLGRMVWELCGRTDLESIAHYDDQALRYAGRDGVIATAYGARLMAQMPCILELLRKDKATRRAVGTVLDNGRDDMNTRLEYPCAIATQYLLRGGRLHCVTFMRSQSVWGVLPYDIALFTLFQEYVAWQLGVELGAYTHVMGSAHVYDGELEKVKSMVGRGDLDARPMVPFFGGLPSLAFLGECEESLRKIGKLSPDQNAVAEKHFDAGWSQALFIVGKHPAPAKRSPGRKDKIKCA